MWQWYRESGAGENPDGTQNDHVGRDLRGAVEDRLVGDVDDQRLAGRCHPPLAARTWEMIRTNSSLRARIQASAGTM
jgi:hypothetical protein